MILTKEQVLNNFRFDGKSLKLFGNEFYPIDNKLSENIKGFHQSPSYGKIPCPKCKSLDSNEYKDQFICFKCKFKKIYFNIDRDFILEIDNGYLCRINKKTKKIEYFHRFIMKSQIELFKKHNPGFRDFEIHIHHQDHNKTNNELINLEVMDMYSHFNHHRDFSENRAFQTWCEKVKGYVDYIYFDEFLNWKIEKENEL